MSGATGNCAPQLIHASGLETALLATSQAPNLADPVSRFVAQGCQRVGRHLRQRPDAWGAASPLFPCAGWAW